MPRMVFEVEPHALRDLVEQRDLEVLRSLGGVTGVANKLHTHLEAGLESHADESARLLRYGRNVIPPAERQTFLDFAKEALSDKTMLILIGAAVLSLVLGLTTPDPRTGVVEYSTGWIEGAAILASVAIVVVVTAVNDYKKQEKFAELETSSSEFKSVTVIRGGEKMLIPSTDIMVGDILLAEPGTRFSVDMLLIKGVGVICDESDVTGECDEIHKETEGDPFLVSGTNLLEGSGYGLVVAVGVNSVSGSIALVTRATKKQTPLEEKLERLADRIGQFGLAAATATFLVLAAKETHKLWSVPGETFSFMKYWEMLTTAVAIVVVAVPEGLPLSVTISLAYSMQQMLEDKNLVRHLAACETMGGATCICSDKTGTLTTNEMCVSKLWLGGQSFDIAKPASNLWISIHTGYEASQLPVSAQDEISLGVDRNLIALVAKTIAFSSIDENNRTSIALTYVSRRLGYGQRITLSETPHRRLPFTSVHKQSKTRIHDSATGGSILYCKGASEVVLSRCNFWVNGSGERQELTLYQRSEIEQGLNRYAEDGLRTLCIAMSQSNIPYDSESIFDDQEAGLTFLAIAGIEEPIRPEVADAVSQCRQAGIRIKMVTGDNKVSAVTVARRCGIADDINSLAMEGREFRSLPPEELQAILPSLCVLARATPLDKQILVEALKKDPNQVVAVTGDGTNDGPALKCADVGFAMNSGTDIAKAASDIILTDDNFVGVVKAVMWGRNVNDNIHKFIQFQLTVNGAACAIAVLGAFLSETNLSPLKPVQLLWLNLIMDSLAALGLATELPSPSLLNRPPARKEAPIISREMWGFILGQGQYQLYSCLFMLMYGHEWMQVTYFDEEHLTLVFNTFVLLQVVNFFNARLLTNEINICIELHRSKSLIIIAGVIAFLQVLIINYGGKFFGVVPITLDMWTKCLFIALGTLPAGVLVKLFMRRRMRYISTASLSKGSPRVV
eukprot:TRINITY_DN647_c1_g1_i1.p1 TRINITY_DN647_c1_g1~~TRINITY_DN647_c1_g1_i1.p1  ORF type:complete len:960 (+),score=320.38 TRINITY_DN647_c1_g1_i1:209-3088(+)